MSYVAVANNVTTHAIANAEGMSCLAQLYVEIIMAQIVPTHIFLTSVKTLTNVISASQSARTHLPIYIIVRHSYVYILV